MNAQEYIASGLLEAYVLGALSGTEADEVLYAISRYPEVAAEVRAIEETMLHMAQAQAVTPPAGLQNVIWDKIRQEHSAAPEEEIVKAKAPTKTIPLAPQKRGWQWAAVLIVLVGSLIGNMMLWNGQRNAEADKVALQQMIDTLSQNQRNLAVALTRYQHEADMMADPAMKTVVMQTTQKDHPMAATVYWNAQKSLGYVSVQKLPAPPQGMQYQLWAIADGKPVDLGVLHNDMIGNLGMEKVSKAITGAQAFAISLEKEGGSPTPTMDKIYVMGKVI